MLNTDTVGMLTAFTDMGTFPIFSIYALSRARKLLSLVWEASFWNKTSSFLDIIKNP